MEKKTINSIETLYKVLKEIDGTQYIFIFRGENKKNDYPCSSTLFRFLKDKSIEALYIPYIQAEIILKAQKHLPSKNTIEILAEIQHYGGKTNLIDFTKNILIAVFFACYGNEEQNKEDGFIYIIKKDSFLKIDEQNFKVEKKNENIQIHNNITRQVIKNSIQVEGTKIIEPYNSNSRILIQHSVFLYNNEGKIPENEYKTITIKSGIKQAIVEELKKKFDISIDTIYNDIMGFISNENNYIDANKPFYYMLNEKYAEAEEAYKKAIAIDPKNAELHYELSICYTAQWKDTEAEEAYNEAIKIDPKYTRKYNIIF